MHARAAVFGIIMWAGLYGRGQIAQDMGHVLFSLFNVAWASLYLEAWRRYSVELAFRWGTLSTPPELLEPPRPLYKVRKLFCSRNDRPLRAQNANFIQGTLVENPVTGRLEPKESPPWQRRAFRYLVSFPVIGLCLAMVFCVMFLMLRLQVYHTKPITLSTNCSISFSWLQIKHKTKPNFQYFNDRKLRYYYWH